MSITLRLRLDNTTHEITIPRPNPKQRVCDLGEPLVRGVWSDWVIDRENTPKWESDASEKP